MSYGQAHSKSSSRNLSSARNLSIAETSNIRDKKADQQAFQKFNKDLAEVLSEMQNGCEIDDNSMRFIIDLIKTVRPHNVDSLTLKSTDIDIKEFCIILIKLGFINLNRDSEINKLIMSKTNLQESTNCESNYNSHKGRPISQAKANMRYIEETSIINEVKLASTIWTNLMGNEKGFISLRNLKVYLVAIMNLWFNWMKEPQNPDKANSKTRKNYQILSKNNKNSFNSKVNKENSLEHHYSSQNKIHSIFENSDGVFDSKGDFYIQNQAVAKKIHCAFQKLADNRSKFIKKVNIDLFQNSQSESNDELSNTYKFMKIKTRHSDKPDCEQNFEPKVNNECIHTYQQSIQENKKLKEILEKKMSNRLETKNSNNKPYKIVTECNNNTGEFSK